MKNIEEPIKTKEEVEKILKEYNVWKKKQILKNKKGGK